MISLSQTFAVVSLTLFSFSDLRYRLVPGIEIFFLGTILLALPASPVQTLIVLVACIWGLIGTVPNLCLVPLLFYPPVWPVLLTGYGYRKGIIGRADLLAIGGLACLFPLPATLFSLLGLEVWRRVWIRRQPGSIPALPGLLLGTLAFLLIRILFPLS